MAKYDLTVQLAELETTYESEASGLRKLVTMMEDREARQKETVNAIERDWAKVREKAEQREAVLKEEIEKEKRGKSEARRNVEQLESISGRVGRASCLSPDVDLRLLHGLLARPTSLWMV